ncbi:unnamed protein product [Mycena citricolor]|uniref:Uncharacterized protein n=1 Tax=Mycena citricolor TaxID=2018698 RepID=A0AAD2JZL2_9AGAR|nr:unnamed protein product [Mycena citricolor]
MADKGCSRRTTWKSDQAAAALILLRVETDTRTCQSINHLHLPVQRTTDIREDMDPDTKQVNLLLRTCPMGRLHLFLLHLFHQPLPHRNFHRSKANSEGLEPRLRIRQWAALVLVLVVQSEETSFMLYFEQTVVVTPYGMRYISIDYKTRNRHGSKARKRSNSLAPPGVDAWRPRFIVIVHTLNISYAHEDRRSTSTATSKKSSVLCAGAQAHE